MAMPVSMVAAREAIGLPVAGGLALNGPSGRALLALTPLAVLLAGLLAYCLIDLARARKVRYLPKPVWALVIVLVSWPLGALIYLLFGKDRGDGQDGRDATSPGAREGELTRRGGSQRAGR